MSIHVMTLGLTAAAGISKKDIFREHSTPSTASQGPDRGTMTYAKTCKNLMEYQQELMNKEIQERTYGLSMFDACYSRVGLANCVIALRSTRSGLSCCYRRWRCRRTKRKH